MHRESRIYRQIGHFLMPSSGNLVTKNKQLSRAVDLLSQASEEIDRLTAELAAVKEESAETCRKLLEDNHRIEVQLAKARKDTERLNWLDHYPAIIRYAAIVGSKVRPIIDRHMYECMSDAERAAIEDAATPEANTGCSPTSPPAIDEAKGESNGKEPEDER